MSDSSLNQSAPSSSGQPGFIRRQLQGAPVTTGIIVVCTVIYLVTAALSRSFMDNLEAPEVIQFAVFGDGLRYLDWSLWTVLTGAFLHSGPAHLLSNMLLMFLAAPQVERFWGSIRYLAMVLVCALAGSAAVMVWAPHTITVGFSGAVLGIWMVLGAQFALIDPKLVRGILVFVVVTLAMPFYVDGISWAAHAGGMLAGLAIGLGWFIASKRLEGRARNTALNLVPVFVGAAVVAVLVFSTS